MQGPFVRLARAQLIAAAMLVTLGLTSCGSGDGSASQVPPGSLGPVSPTATPTAVATPFAALRAATTIDPANLANYAAPALPPYYDGQVAQLDNEPAANPVNDRLATLGRVLFYDRQLSFNRTVACASCHQQAAGFDDPSRFSLGFTGSAFTSAHAMRLGNIRYWRPRLHPGKQGRREFYGLDFSERDDHRDRRHHRLFR